ncbi:DUF1801 domain-containing protein [Mycoplasmatota bacterium]|nr:DUF1801 domain-containing protein [Mycoplasmatota bacterium]
MSQKYKNVADYMEKLPVERKRVFNHLRQVIKDSLPEGYEETMSYDMLAYVVPKSIYPQGYKANKEEPLPLMYLASQKKHIALYHMGIYLMPDLSDWFKESYKKIFNQLPDMGKSCIRFKKMDTIPYDLIKELVSKLSVKAWIRLYEDNM